MATQAWIIAVDPGRLMSTMRVVQDLVDEVTIAIVGPRSSAEAAAAAGATRVVWVDSADLPVEAFAAGLAVAVATAAPALLLAASDPGARVLLGAAAAQISAASISGVESVSRAGDGWLVERPELGGATVATMSSGGPLAVQVAVDADAQIGTGAAPIEALLCGAVPDLQFMTRRPASTASGLLDAARVVSVGRGVRAKTDIALAEELAAVLGAEIGCSMPVADDLGWVAKERYVGRSGQKISPRLYVALGISGMPQHLEGVRDAKIIAAVNIDPDAPIFRAADYGIVGDLYEVVPALVGVLSELT